MKKDRAGEATGTAIFFQKGSSEGNRTEPGESTEELRLNATLLSNLKP